MLSHVAPVAMLLVAWLPPPAAAISSEPFDVACRSAMVPYYAALLASARGDADGTLRQLLLLKSRWDDVARRFGTDGPDWLRSSSGGQTVAAAVATRIDAARRRLPRDVAGAHSELEAVRALLRDARSAHAARTLDDAVTDYHDAMERLSSHAGASNEIALSAADFSTIQADAVRAQSRWRDVAAFGELRSGGRSWTDVDTATTRALSEIVSAAARRDAEAAQVASDTLKRRYFDLVAMLSHRQ